MEKNKKWLPEAGTTPLHPDIEKKIKGRDKKLSEEITEESIIGDFRPESVEARKVMERVKEKAKRLKDDIKYYNSLIVKKYKRNTKEWKDFQDLSQKIYEENEKLADISKVEENAEKIQQKFNQLMAVEQQIELLLAAIEERKQKLSALEEPQ